MRPQKASGKWSPWEAVSLWRDPAGTRSRNLGAPVPGTEEELGWDEIKAGVSGKAAVQLPTSLLPLNSQEPAPNSNSPSASPRPAGEGILSRIVKQLGTHEQVTGKSSLGQLPLEMAPNLASSIILVNKSTLLPV